MTGKGELAGEKSFADKEVLTTFAKFTKIKKGA
jgi:hypothetical protein